MSKFFKYGTFSIALICVSLFSMAQANYYMGNKTVYACTGFFLDSDAGAQSGDYDHNEDFTFTICVANASSITLNFSSFCTEATYDILRFFDGPDTMSTQIGGNYSGNISPGVIVSTGSYLTIHFISDANVVCTGWQALWTTTLTPPVPPTLNAIPTVTCFSDTIYFSISQYIPCDSVYDSAFLITGNGSPVIASVSDVNCSGDTTVDMMMVLTQPITNSGTFTIYFTYFFLDECDSLWEFNMSQTFWVNDCPIDVYILAYPDTICEGFCSWLYAIASGGDSTSYTYSWSGGLPGNAWVQACPTVTTTYQVVVDDAGPATPDSATIEIFVKPKPNGGPDTAICESASPITLVGTPGGGYFTGVGITDSANGIFDPDTSGAGVFDILYYFNGCPDSVLVTVIPIQAGLDNASCPGASPFTVYPGSPGVGTWSGNYIQPNGVFDPLVTGTHTIFYSVNGCIDSKFVYVDTLWIQIGDSICDVDPPYNLAFSPQGGVWTGIGITDTVNGVFDPGVSGVGIFQLIYTANGCADTLDMRVDLINAGVNETACPTQGPYTLTAGLPSGGIWAGIGIIDSILGIFDPGIQGGNYNDSLTYTFVGCSDIKVIYVRQTVIAVDTLTFCPADDSIFLNWTNVGRNPWDGVWKGPGVTDSMFPGVFDPGVTGPGMYMLTYTANICYDSIIMHVYDYPVTQNDTTVCISSSPFNLSAIPPNGLWSGNGIINANDGTFNPAVVGIGTFKVYYTSPGGCIDSMNVSTDTLPLVNLSGLVNVYCYLDTNIVMSGSPLGGTFSGAGVSGSIFNPKNAGGGVHTIKYTFANGVCTVTDSMIVSVYDPLVISLPFVLDTICFGDSVLLTAMSLGGDTNALHIYTWDNGLGTGPTQWLKADSQTTFTVIVSDGCSISDTGTLTIFIQPEFLLMIDTSNSVCFGDTGYAKVTVTGSGAFIYEWNTDPPNYTDSISSVGGLYTITVTNTMTGCILDEEIEIPSYNPIYAFFKPSPDKECFNTLEDVIYFIDLSVGGKTGIWDFGDGQTKPYISPENPVHLYSAPGYYTISLYLENEGGCKSEHSSLICLEEKSTLFVPTAFTPDGDGLNDVFQVVSFGVTEINFAIYSRWGDEVFQTNDPNIGWDGRFRGKVMPQGVYVYFVDYRTKESPWLQKKKGSLVLIR